MVQWIGFVWKIETRNPWFFAIKYSIPVNHRGGTRLGVLPWTKMAPTVARLDSWVLMVGKLEDIYWMKFVQYGAFLDGTYGGYMI